MLKLQHTKQQTEITIFLAEAALIILGGGMKSDIQIKNVFPGTLVLPVQSYPCYRKYTRGKMYKNIRIRLTYELHSKNPIFIYNIILL